jgi:outer membrane receptor protein involved in Fe transport
LGGSVNAAIRSWGNSSSGSTSSGSSATELPATRSSIGDRDRTAVSPKAAFLYHASEHVSLRAGHYQAFRTPTRNELVRFRIWSATALRDIVGRR